MKNKKIVSLLAALLMVLLSACSVKKTPYLSEAERQSIEDALFSSLHIAEVKSSTQQFSVRLENQTKYDLADVSFRIPKEQTSTGSVISFVSIPNFPAPSEALLKASFPNGTVGDEGLQLFLEYTVGAYTYRSEPRTVPIEKESPKSLEIYVETQSGRVSLDLNGTVTFETGSEIVGLGSAEINSLTSETKDGSNGEFLITIVCDGKEPKQGSTSTYLGYKLIGEDGILWESDVLYFTGGSTATCYFSGGVKPGQYELRFEEHRWGE